MQCITLVKRSRSSRLLIFSPNARHQKRYAGSKIKRELGRVKVTVLSYLRSLLSLSLSFLPCHKMLNNSLHETCELP